jgi:hypothetical protein
MKPHDSTELHHIPLTINVKLKKDDNTGTIFNEVRGYVKRESLISQTPPPNIAAQTQAREYPQATSAPKPDAAPW